MRKRWRPILRLRIRHGRRSMLRPCFSSWARLARVHRCKPNRLGPCVFCQLIRPDTVAAHRHEQTIPVAFGEGVG